MEQINRRNWLRIAGIAGTASLLHPITGSSLADYSKEPFELADPSDIAKLSFNENPYAPSGKVRKAIIEALGDACRYPFMKVAELEKKIATMEGILPEQVIITAGSTEGLKATGLTLGVHGGEIIAADPTYQSLLTYAEHFGAFINRVPLNEHLAHDLEEMEKRVHNDTKMIFICNPNNPSGTIIAKNRLRDFCSSVSQKTIVFSDEAYYDYITEPDYPSMISLVKEGHNVIVSRTFSKVYGLAGLRIGYIMARPDIARRIRPSVMASANILAVAAAHQAINDREFYNYSVQKNMEAKKHIYQVLDEIGLKYIPSHTNFVFFKAGKPIAEINALMSARKVWVGRPFPPLTNWCRVSTGAMPDVIRFGEALKDIMS